MHVSRRLLPAVMLFAFVPALLSATPVLSFHCISAQLTDCAIATNQMTVEAFNVGSGQVQFQFANLGPSPSSITDVYFQDGTLLGIASIQNGAGVQFSQFATPPDLPGGQNETPPFHTTAGFSADSDAPVQPMGVNPGEFMGITFNLMAGTDFSNVVSELTTGALRIGIHVQGFADGGSVSLVNNALVINPTSVPAQTPEPATLMLFGSGLMLVAKRFRQRN